MVKKNSQKWARKDLKTPKTSNNNWPQKRHLNCLTEALLLKCCTTKMVPLNICISITQKLRPHC